MGTMHEEDRPRQPLLDRPLGRGQAVLWWTLASALFILVVVGQFVVVSAPGRSTSHHPVFPGAARAWRRAFRTIP